MNTNRSFLFRLLAAFSSLLLTIFMAPCVQAAPEAREPTKLDIRIIATQDVNPNEKKEAAPIEVRFYELKSGQVFETADYFSLYTKDTEILGAEILKKETMILRPGDSRTINRNSDSETTMIGVLAGYRDLGHSVWRVIYKLPEAPVVSWYRSLIPANKSSLLITVDESGLRVTEK